MRINYNSVMDKSNLNEPSHQSNLTQLRQDSNHRKSKHN